MSQTWQQIWSAKGAAVAPQHAPDSGTLERLMDLGGYTSPTAAGALSAYERHFRYVRESLSIGTGDSVYEVGCGAGALLYWLHTHCRQVGGADFAEPLVQHARAALPAADDLVHADADRIETTPRYDVVLSNGVFLYFASAEYARRVTERMITKATRAIGIFDVNDADRREEALEVRRAAQRERGLDYSGLEQLFLPRELFTSIADRHGLECRIDDTATTASANARYRYHVTMHRR
ncbi:MAG TPA: class I SAM-dependent methyltransferase [Candidatus Ruania gallistercoris]|uniref:Class I SAM-dependent methyltransferase n=1 Tax=Candidatus Ruania gallistercoris TaxID=2838746 RepID=A0A9D2J291_9MICO|nr:class I SAM-dependent methyltransferase [Candidatus Ruania gallistercoris]